jgi:hypothetical protein
MWKVRFPATPCLTYITRMSRWVQPPDTHAKLSPYPCDLRPHSRLFHGDLQTASRNIGTVRGQKKRLIVINYSYEPNTCNRHKTASHITTLHTVTSADWCPQRDEMHATES